MVLVDSNVLLDVFNSDTVWGDWSANQLEQLGRNEVLAVNPIICAEVSLNYRTVGELDTALDPKYFRRLPLPYDAAFLAGQAFKEYRKRGGSRRSPLPDFYIGAHASMHNLKLITRDAPRYRTCFPDVYLIAPNRTG